MLLFDYLHYNIQDKYSLCLIICTKTCITEKWINKSLNIIMHLWSSFVKKIQEHKYKIGSIIKYFIWKIWRKNKCKWLLLLCAIICNRMPLDWASSAGIWILGNRVVDCRKADRWAPLSSMSESNWLSRIPIPPVDLARRPFLHQFNLNTERSEPNNTCFETLWV